MVDATEEAIIQTIVTEPQRSSTDDGGDTRNVHLQMTDPNKADTLRKDGGTDGSKHSTGFKICGGGTFTPTTNAELRAATSAWHSDPESAQVLYGTIEGWDTSPMWSVQQAKWQ